MDSLYLNHTEFMSKSKHQTAKQNQKFPFHFFFRFAVEGWGEETRGKCKEIFWFCTRESASVSEAHYIASPRNRGVRRGLEPLRAPRVRLVFARIVLVKSSDFVQETQPSFRIRFFAKMRSVAKRRSGGFCQNSPRVFEIQKK